MEKVKRIIGAIFIEAMLTAIFVGMVVAMATINY